MSASQCSVREQLRPEGPISRALRAPGLHSPCFALGSSQGLSHIECSERISMLGSRTDKTRRSNFARTPCPWVALPCFALDKRNAINKTTREENRSQTIKPSAYFLEVAI